MSYKNISAELSDEDKGLIIQKFREIETIIDPFAIDLNRDERKELPKMGKKTLGFVEASLGYASNHPNLVPVFLDVNEQSKDLELAKQLQEVMEVAEPVLEKLKDTYMAVGAEAYLAGRVFYDSVKASSKAGTPGSDVIAANLGEIFRRSRPKAQPVIEDTRK